MRIAICLALVPLLAACSVVPRHAWTFDPTRPQPREALSQQEVVALADRLAQLQLERNGIREQIEPDAWKRQDLYQQLHRVGMALSPLERRLGSVASAR